jgi:capsule polysaccharide export protein KpsE/RkpR
MQQEEEGMSLIDIIKGVKEFFAELKKKWLLVTIVVCITSGLGLFYSFTSKPKYIASSTMMLESAKGGSASGALALASQFGLMGGSSSAVITEDKLIEIIKAETIIKTALFKKATIDSSTDILANHFIDLFGYKKAWEKNDSLKNFRFKNSEENMTIQENRVLKMFYAKILTNFLAIEKSKSGIITITITTPSELFSKYFNEYLVEAATSFYVDRITAKGRKSLDIVQKRVDSITIALKDAEFTLARWKDANYRLVKAQGMMEELRLKRNVEIYNSLYLEGVKRLEVSKFTLLDETPFLQIIDKPSLPLDKKETKRIFFVIVGFFVGFLLSGLYVFSRKKYTELMAEASTKTI